MPRISNYPNSNSCKDCLMTFTKYHLSSEKVLENLDWPAKRKESSFGAAKHVVKGSALPLGNINCWTGVPGTNENDSIMVKGHSGL